MKRNIKTKYRLNQISWFRIIEYQNIQGIWEENNKIVIPADEVIGNFLEMSELLKNHGLTFEDVLKYQNEKKNNT